MIDIRDVNHGHLFCGLGGGAKGFNRGDARVGNMIARFRCLGGIDVNPAAIADFERAAGVPGTVLDLFSLEQYRAFHGHEPPAGWRQAIPDDIRKAFGYEHPHIIFLSAPCKGFSGLLSESASRTAKYQALNALTLRGVWLMLEAYADDPVELVVFENVPRIATRGRHLLDQIVALLRSYGYAVAETTHDCGELGGLGQSRKRFLLVARHMEKVPPFLYEPTKKRLRGVGEILERFPLPGAEEAGIMHRVPSLQWKTWVRLAFVEAGSDWRSLNRLNVVDGMLRDYALVPEQPWHGGVLGVQRWEDPCATITSRGTPTTGAYSVADPRIDGHPKSVQMGVRRWTDPAAVVKGDVSVGTGPYAVADPRMDGVRYNNVFRIVRWDEAAPAVAGPGGPCGGLAVADPRYDGEGKDYAQFGVNRWEDPGRTVTGQRSPGQGVFSIADPRTGYGPNSHRNKLAVVGWDDPARTVTGGTQVQGGALSVADPRPGFSKDGRDVYVTNGHYGVVPWDRPSYSVTASGQHDNGWWSVADPRLPTADQRLVAVIRSLDDTWHRPFTTLELAALQGLVDPDEHLELEGLSDSDWRERIGNAVPPPAAQAIASVMGRTLLLAWSGETFMLSMDPIWVRPIALALAVDLPTTC